MEPEEKKAKTVSFNRWLELACFRGGLRYREGLIVPVFTMFVLIFGAGILLLINIATFPVLGTLLVALGLALRYRWKKDLANPPPFLLEEMEK